MGGVHVGVIAGILHQRPVAADGQQAHLHALGDAQGFRRCAGTCVDPGALENHRILRVLQKLAVIRRSIGRGQVGGSDVGVVAFVFHHRPAAPGRHKAHLHALGHRQRARGRAGLGVDLRAPGDHALRPCHVVVHRRIGREVRGVGEAHHAVDADHRPAAAGGDQRGLRALFQRDIAAGEIRLLIDARVRVEAHRLLGQRAAERRQAKADEQHKRDAGSSLCILHGEASFKSKLLRRL